MKKLIFRISVFSCLLFFTLAYTLSAVEVVKSKRDLRSYRVTTLPNQLQVVLVSDPDLKQTAVSLSVGAGYNLDPVERPGLFHFMEHMLFLGTKKYPSSKSYGDYLSRNGGRFNAYTSAEQTNYFFSVNSNAIDGALDRFSQFFIAPLFTKTYVEREMHAVESEHSKNLTSDARRILQVTKSTVDPRHPFAKFGTGNLKTLSSRKGEDVIQVLKAMFKTYYSSNLMKLAMVGNHSLDEMEKKVRIYFSPIKNKQTSPLPTPPSPFGRAYVKKQVEIEPLNDIRKLRVYFPIPQQTTFYKEKPTILIGKILGDEGRGSLLSLLKRKNWATALSAGSLHGGIGFETFGVGINLTRDGLENRNKVIELVFQMIKRIQTEGIKKSYFNEEQKLREIQFDYLTKNEPIDDARTLTSNLQEFPAEDLLRLNLLRKWNPARIKELLKRLTPENIRIEIIAKGLKQSKREKWYGTAYHLSDIPKTSLHRWESVPLHPELKLPAPNPFIPEKVSLVQGGVTKTPEKILEDPALTLWYKKDGVFQSPKVAATFAVDAPAATQSAKQWLMIKLYTELIKDELTEYAYPAYEAGLKYSIQSTQQGFKITLNGYPEKMGLLFKTIISKMKALEIKKDRFFTYLEMLQRGLKNHPLQKSHALTAYEFKYLLSKNSWHINELTAAGETLKLEDLQKFIPSLLKNLSSEGLIYGNITKPDALKLAKILQEGLLQNRSSRGVKALEGTINLPPQTVNRYQQKITDVNSSIISYYQHGPETKKTRAIQGLMGTMISRPFYSQLRTKEQLGYIVHAAIANLHTVNGFQFIVQSAVKDPVDLEGRIISFLKTYYPILAATSEESFQVYRKALIQRLLQPVKNLKEQNMLYWHQISNHRYDFEIYQELAKALETITLNDVLSYYKEIFFNKGKRLTVQSFGAPHPLRKGEKGLTIQSQREFKKNATYYQLFGAGRQ